MPVELKVPTVGESISEVQIGEWFKGEGQQAEKDESLVEIETDKATVEIAAPAAGRVAKVLKQKGETAAVGEVIGYLETSDESAQREGARKTEEPSKRRGPPPSAAPQEKEAEILAEAERTDGVTKKAKKDQKPTKLADEERAEQAPVETAERAEGPPGAEGTSRTMPAARRALAQQRLRAEEVEATGPGGRLLKEDVLRHVAPEPKEAPHKKPVEAPQVPSRVVREEEVVPMSPIRRRIAERLVEAQRTAALLTTFNEIDMSAVMALRQKHRQAYEEKYGIKLGFMSFFIKAAIDALKQVPQVNAEVRGNNIVYRNYADIGIAVGGGKGLVVPVLRNAERMSFAEIELAISDFARRAQQNQVKLEELQGGTFTITNGGIYGSMLSTPIINPPQSGILGMHAIQERPVARDGAVVIRPMMYVALTYDHRIVDGREAVTFLKRIKEVIEEPARMLLEI